MLELMLLALCLWESHFSSLDLSFLILENRTMTHLLAVTHEDRPAKEVKAVSSCHIQRLDQDQIHLHADL